MRDIAKAVGIRESSLYNHFAGKREIFNAIVDICWQKAEEYYHSHGLPFGEDDGFAPFRQSGPLEENVLAVFRYFFEDRWNLRFRRLLTMSQYDDEHAGQLYKKLYCWYPIQVQTAIFRGLTEAGELTGEPKELALEFYGGVFLLMCCCEDWQEAEPKLQKHIAAFQRTHGKKQGT